ncbi:acyl-CoA dehydrogenase family protein [Hoeflea ulvae]|uniref:Acyl-CoA dehydrogenase family protein n=1 Tax=Hoeflea ulvae TaxID=2983764 RepID=A0ABT3YCX7_9HYPH|nr:acyl-CoA dehydrogenase family protein [Hoeflea ulvae]MCY0093741.1 acyl-CoA dehydrogenase family protein [Hoeflea ulvae]
MLPFKAPVDDILFSLLRVARASRVEGLDVELLREIIGHFASFAEEVIAPLDEPGDRQGCRLENGRVRMPYGFREAYADYAAQGWPGLTLAETHGGQALPGVVLAAISEIFSGACHSLQMVTGLVPGAARTIERFGTEAQKARYLPALASGACLSTMCLTEPGAGSDLSMVRTRAIKGGKGWKLSGEKIFISGGDQDLSDDILHLVLARTGAPEDGVKGLSLFLCPSQSDGVRNAVSVIRIEDKMGLHASPTCQLLYDSAEAELLGGEGEGLHAMFTMMNHARLDVALQGVAHASRAHDIASAYAAERRQGRKPDGAPAVLSDHADIRRMLDTQRSLALGARAMCHIALVELELGGRPQLIEFLTPLCKVFATEAGMRSADLGIQVLGGYGYLHEYRVEQTFRDARITAIYEGANGIHELGLATRGLSVHKGAGADAFGNLITELAEDAPDVMGQLEAWRALRAQVVASDQPAELAHEFAQASAQLFFRAVWNRMATGRSDFADAAEMARLSGFVARKLKGSWF